MRLNKVPHFTNAWRREVENSVGGPNAWIDAYGLLEISKLRFYSEPMREALADTNPWNELDFPLERAQRWDPLHRGVWIAARVLLAGHLLQAKGDRVAMHSSVEVRYPFLDEDVFDFLAKLHPRWRLRGFRDKHLLRLLAERWVPTSVARRHKVIFRAPLDSFHMEPEPPFVAQLLSEESLRKTGYFDSAAVARWRNDFRKMRAGSLPRLSVEMGLMAVVATQLWHHLFMGGGLADLPEWSAVPTPAAIEAGAGSTPIPLTKS
jgi:asparagine synthase (glutamine-hydrolysing)